MAISKESEVIDLNDKQIDSENRDLGLADEAVDLNNNELDLDNEVVGLNKKEASRSDKDALLQPIREAYDALTKAYNCVGTAKAISCSASKLMQDEYKAEAKVYLAKAYCVMYERELQPEDVMAEVEWKAQHEARWAIKGIQSPAKQEGRLKRVHACVEMMVEYLGEAQNEGLKLYNAEQAIEAECAKEAEAISKYFEAKKSGATQPTKISEQPEAKKEVTPVQAEPEKKGALARAKSALRRTR